MSETGTAAEDAGNNAKPQRGVPLSGAFAGQVFDGTKLARTIAAGQVFDGTKLARTIAAGQLFDGTKLARTIAAGRLFDVSLWLELAESARLGRDGSAVASSSMPGQLSTEQAIALASWFVFVLTLLLLIQYYMMEINRLGESLLDQNRVELLLNGTGMATLSIGAKKTTTKILRRLLPE
jgi:hypothetical protein